MTGFLTATVNVPAELRDRSDPPEVPCCMGSVFGENRCYCWEPIYDLEQAPLYEYVWRWKGHGTQRQRTDIQRQGQPCRVLIRGGMNSALIEFPDGYRVVTSRSGLRKRKPDEIPTAAKCCHDCAYRNGSPERADEYDEGVLLAHAQIAGEEFWCHQGCRRVIAFRHPDGRELPAGDGDYRPPIGPEERPVVWRADGTVAQRCAGWNAHRA